MEKEFIHELTQISFSIAVAVVILGLGIAIGLLFNKIFGTNDKN
jgi:hypothetical protein